MDTAMDVDLSIRAAELAGRELVSHLHSCQLLQGWPQDILEKLAATASVVRVQKGTYVARQWTRFSHLLVVKEGMLSFKVSNIAISIRGPGDFGGWSALLGDPLCLTDIVAEVDSTLIRIRGSHLRGILEQNPLLAYATYEMMADRVRQTNRSLLELRKHLLARKSPWNSESSSF